MKTKTYANHLSKFLLCLIAALSLCAVFALAGCSSGGDSSADTSATTEAAESTDAAATDDGSYTLVEEGKLTVVASIDFPPFENLVDGKPEGFEVDLMTAIA